MFWAENSHLSIDTHPSRLAAGIKASRSESAKTCGSSGMGYGGWSRKKLARQPWRGTPFLRREEKYPIRRMIRPRRKVGMGYRRQPNVLRNYSIYKIE